MLEIYYIAIINVIIFFIGYLLGRYRSGSISTVTESKPKSFLNQTKQNATKVDIDETKVIPRIDTGSLSKKYDNLGETKMSDTNIGDSINKLKNLKK